MDDLKTIIDKIKEARIFDSKARDRRDIKIIEDSRDWFRAKREVDKLPLDWQIKLSEIVQENPLSATSDENGICAHFTVQDFPAELTIVIKNNDIKRVCYEIFNDKTKECYRRNIPKL